MGVLSGNIPACALRTGNEHGLVVGLTCVLCLGGQASGVSQSSRLVEVQGHKVARCLAGCVQRWRPTSLSRGSLIGYQRSPERRKATPRTDPDLQDHAGHFHIRNWRAQTYQYTVFSVRLLDIVVLCFGVRSLHSWCSCITVILCCLVKYRVIIHWLSVLTS